MKSYILNDGRLALGVSVASAILALESTTQGFLPPRMSTTERDAIVSPAAGLMIFNTTANEYQWYNLGGLTWESFSTGSGSGDVNGPGSSTDRAIAIWDGLTGSLLQNSKFLLKTDNTFQLEDNDINDSSDAESMTISSANKNFAGGGSGGDLDIFSGASIDGRGGNLNLHAGGSSSGISGSVAVLGRLRITRQTISSSTNVSKDVTYVGVTDTSSPWTLTLPLITDVGQGTIYIFKDESFNAANNNITITRSVPDVIDNGLGSYVMRRNGGCVGFIAGSGAWHSILDTNNVVQGPGSSAANVLAKFTDASGANIGNALVRESSGVLFVPAGGGNISLQVMTNTDKVTIGFDPNALMTVAPLSGSNGVQISINTLQTIRLQGFVAASGNGGAANLRGGDAAAGTGGPVNINGGSSALTGAGALVTIQGGSNTVGAGGGLNLIAGSSNAAGQNGASVSIRGGQPGSGGTPGSIGFTTGTSAGGSTRLTIDPLGNIVLGTAALATSATDGFLYISASAGTPVGTPTTFTGRAPIHIDTTNNVFYFYSGGQWRSPAGGFANGGNTFGAVGSLGTNDNFELRFRTNNVEKLVLETAAPTLRGVTSNTDSKDVTFKGGKGASGNVVGGSATLIGGEGIGTGAGGDAIVEAALSLGSGAVGRVKMRAAGTDLAYFDYNQDGAGKLTIVNGGSDVILEAGQLKLHSPFYESTDDTPVPFWGFTTNTDSIGQIEVRFKAFNSTTQDMATWTIRLRYKNLSDVLTITEISREESKDAGAAVWTLDVVSSGATLLLQAAGGPTDDIFWDGIVIRN